MGADIFTNIMWLAINIFFEARGENMAGKVAVGHVTINRTRKRKMSVKEVVLQHAQFSWTLDSDPQVKAIHVLDDAEAFEECLKAARRVAEDIANGYTLDGADHYYNPKGVKRKPHWATVYKKVGIIGKHHFYKS